MRLPDRCSARSAGQQCRLSPSHVVSVQSHDGEYMVAVVCDDHKRVLEKRLPAMQKEDKIPKGKLRFQSVRTVVTDCIMGLSEDYIDLELKRGISTDRKLS